MIVGDFSIQKSVLLDQVTGIAVIEEFRSVKSTQNDHIDERKNNSLFAPQ